MDKGRRLSQLVTLELIAEAKKQGIKQKDVAKAAGISAPQLSYYAAGVRGLMTLGTFSNACTFLGVDPRHVVGRAQDKLLSEIAHPSTSAIAITDADLDAAEEAARRSARPRARVDRE
ncbi:helix-turn-helix domain-containing protein [Rarobacter faecitabidus]|uniref:helix-turn-helix domain-containing protein n=1 Tax=Rarobacter faecitabidus TaxID=13243 RepID=UPI001151F735